jgi:hypothetical protein
MGLQSYLDYFIHLPLVRSKLISDDLVVKTEILYNRIIGYRGLCLDFMDANNNLLDAIRKYNK